MKKQYTSSIIKNHKITKKSFFDGVPLKGYVASKVIFRFCTRNQKKHYGNIQWLMTLKFQNMANMQLFSMMYSSDAM